MSKITSLVIWTVIYSLIVLSCVFGCLVHTTSFSNDQYARRSSISTEIMITNTYDVISDSDVRGIVNMINDNK
jgi:hypothetical protein